MITIVPQRTGRYASFPTFTTHEDQLIVFYREGKCGDPRTHGEGGKVMALHFPLVSFLAALEDPSREDMTDLMTAQSVLFAGDSNEMDAIVSKLGTNSYALATRSFAWPDNTMTTYLSLAATPDFSHRVAVTVPGVSWLVFYGKGVSKNGHYIFPAYGGLGDGVPFRPLLIATKDGETFSLYQALPSPADGNTLNESSLAFCDDRWHLFSRQGKQPFGIWHTSSPDLKQWEQPKRLFDKAHAPMALTLDHRILLSYRRIIDDHKAASALSLLFDGATMDMASYEGNIYHGGYTDLGVVGDRLVVFYYQGNLKGEPFICCWSKPICDL